MKINNYEINILTLAIIPIDDEKSKVIEKNREIIVNLSTTKIIDNSCKFFGSSYDGRLKGTQNLINIKSKSPIIIEETKKIVFFPTTSSRHNKCTWLSLNNIYNYYDVNDKTLIKFSCGKELVLPISYGIIDNQVLRATRLLYVISYRAKQLDDKNNKNL